ncbi:hypothetical protein CABS01_12248 [Colletotrichum abscissum]|uniref:Uncharacterized protein n=3 Tax=Colletotrichum acutatum species complex TaxID=2707335 RepID=A0A9Q0B5B1_9PEZI|nr:uncharacterized protein CCOS01_01172 [Colletotrichum costaricense]XP_060384841.1 uncharacterized protein CTAM01_04166 [Colletotrichum tamarilloi]XP_060396775.1 uncharacterized protein CABS01_12248 [Colletotrichum abscissum]KAI3532040.1 hypothetical protein CSPX01_13779 [Colletotrichum filicis]KAI3557640.1 hypothetical protein CABS02_02299 [Colletotrichum abscissum]KAK1491155.1 hypothetical protein CABS01_12248 [Colletotrichum abscissum]KAK1503936.1 hypothetical protein CTAM01_04166 [Collet
MHAKWKRGLARSDSSETMRAMTLDAQREKVTMKSGTSDDEGRLGRTRVGVREKKEEERKKGQREEEKQTMRMDASGPHVREICAVLAQSSPVRQPSQRQPAGPNMTGTHLITQPGT